MRYALVSLFHIGDVPTIVVASDVGKHQFIGGVKGDCIKSAQKFLSDHGLEHSFDDPQFVWVSEVDVSYRIGKDEIPRSAEDFVAAYRKACRKAGGLVSKATVQLGLMPNPTHVTLPVKNCARCGGDHPIIQYRPFTSKPPSYTHFGTCPDTGEPILLSMVEVPD